ncbi:MAG TPA: hypothetical protein VI197_20185 [Polyangiaceae bacterium]
MPERKTLEKAKQALRQGKSPKTAAGEFVREEIEHVREGKHGARSPEQAIAIGLAKARRAGIPLPPPGPGQTSESTRRAARRDYETGQLERKPRKSSKKRGKAAVRALKREGKTAVSKRALSAHAKRSAAKRAAAKPKRAAAKAQRKPTASKRKAAKKSRRG